MKIPGSIFMVLLCVVLQVFIPLGIENYYYENGSFQHTVERWTYMATAFVAMTLAMIAARYPARQGKLHVFTSLAINAITLVYLPVAAYSYMLEWRRRDKEQYIYAFVILITVCTLVNILLLAIGRKKSVY